MPNKHIYHKPKRINPEVMARKIDKLSNDLEGHRLVMDAVIQSYNRHMEYLANFARHDMGNAIQNISATIKLIENDINKEAVDALRSSVNNLNSTLDNLGKLIPYSPDRTFKLKDLLTATTILVRSSSAAKNIAFSSSVEDPKQEIIRQPFQALLQLMHNLIINAQKSFTDQVERKIKMEANIVDDLCVIKVMNTGNCIPDHDIDKIFEFGFSTTGGSGIGLFHAKYLCKKIGGSISVSQNIGEYTTIFTITFPKHGPEKNIGD